MYNKIYIYILYISLSSLLPILPHTLQSFNVLPILYSNGPQSLALTNTIKSNINAATLRMPVNIIISI